MQKRTKLLVGTVASASIIASSIYLPAGKLFQATESLTAKMNQVTEYKPAAYEMKASDSSPHEQKQQKNHAKEFSEGERKQFVFDVTRVFGTLVISAPNPETLRPHLEKLNEHGEAAIEFISKELSRPASQDSEVKERLHLIDYLNYRLRWDNVAIEKARQIVEEPIPANTPTRYRATTIVEKSEIIEGIARVNWQLAAELIIATNSNQVKRLASSASYYVLVEGGKTTKEALIMIKKINPNFQI